MTDRLEKAIHQLSDAEQEQLAEYAEHLAQIASQRNTNSGEPMKLEWVGALRHGPWKSGMEAQEAAKHYRLFLLERGASR